MGRQDSAILSRSTGFPSISMSNAALSIRWFAAYLFLLGAALATVPNPMLSIFGFPGTAEVWIRVAGVLVFNIGLYYWAAAPAEHAGFFMATVFARTLVVIAFTMFVLFGFAKPVLIGIGMIDFIGAMWTLIALKKRS